jgi:alpha-1,3-fucosyltransferase
MNKTKVPCAWMASNGRPPSGRQKLVKKLQEFIEVDIFGGIGNKSVPCPRPGDERISKCDIMMQDRYKFYFSFENHILVDYTTEKLFKILNAYIVPVVFNGANMTRFLPPKSYVNANDFKTAEDLAKHLLFLSDNPEEYVKYFWWKKHYRVEETGFYFNLRQLCKICEKLNTPNLEFKTQIYTNIKQWNEKNTFVKPNIEF